MSHGRVALAVDGAGLTSLPLRRRVRLAIVAATAVALVVFAVPLMIAIRTVYVQQSETELEREAARVLAVVSNDTILSPNVLPAW